ncbi:uncharacterized protein LOC127079000 [Lathyrus oleraceus]|uniref:uncharacterized protein LOC127079000 n=1 Tax=Pisum sativum TaxID=3888 RepID=UPI0021D29700|nr:uncharacterized protein LOC127079000 [Pisum sativum]
MADQEQELKRVSSELEDLRGNMGQVMEILQVIRAKLDTQTTVVSEIVGPTIEPQPARTVPTTWPAYGLPPSFTPPVEGAPGFAQSTQQTAPLPTINENHPVVHTFAPPLVRAHVQPYFEDQQHAPDFSDEDDERKEDIIGMKENFQILEKRLRAMEGDQVFGATAKEMFLVSGLVIPAKFKTPDFDRYEGHSCPKTVTPNFIQSQALVYQPVQQAPVYQQAPAPPVYQQPRAQAPHPQNPPNQNRVQRGRLPFASIPMTYTELYPSLLQKGLVTPRPLGPPPNSLPPWYNPNAHFPFHGGSPGHDLEGCYALKHIVRDLVEKKILSFRDVGPNVKNNPLPAHGDVNAIEDASDVCIIKNVENVKTPLLALHARLVGARLIDTCHDNCEECVVHPRGCKVVQTDIQNLMDQGVLQICGPTTSEEVSVIEPVFNLPEPFEHQGGTLKYDITVVDGVVDGKPKAAESKKGLENVDTDITNIAGTSRMTRSGRIYTPNINVNPQEPTREATNVNPTPEHGGAQPAVQADEASEFLRIIKKSDYKIVDQLHQTP